MTEWLSRRHVLGLGLMAITTTGCTPPKVRDTRIIRPMGDRVNVGQLIYNVLEAEWKAELGEVPNVRRPKHQFLVLRLSVTNAGGQNAGFPLLSLSHEGGEKYAEVDDVKELSDWMGLIRTGAPGETAMGSIVFDVPKAPYVLNLTDGKIEGESTGYVEIPLRLS